MPKRKPTPLFDSLEDAADPSLKRCSDCEQLKPLEQFYRRTDRVRVGRLGHMSHCKACHTVKIRVRRRELAKDRPPPTPEQLEERRAKRREYIRKQREAGTLKVKKYPKQTYLGYFMHGRYGITWDDYNRMFAQQGGVCAICGEPERRKKRGSQEICKLTIDHCHATRQVRGLTCSLCNMALGGFRDNPAIMWKAIEYLARAKARAKATG